MAKGNKAAAKQTAAPATESVPVTDTTAAPAPAPAPELNTAPEAPVSESVDQQEAPAAAEEIVEEIADAGPETKVDGVKLEAAGMSLMAQLIVGAVNDYIVAMAPNRPVSTADGARRQVQLYRALTDCINKLDEEFSVVFGGILKLFNEHKDGVFHEVNVFRFMENVNLGEADRRSFLNILNLIKLTADHKGRAVALRQVRLEESLKHGITDAGRQKVMAFFQV